ncbi:MAG: hypothetical protein M1412_04800 [Deltaproteobacteria bacterium]|nr:hypothetical protein [Deltaproteobacteria bacterium]MCL5892467.1 hypothetical protein [Deltaproteobacteria bacterium]
MKTVKFLKIFSIGFIVLAIGIAGLASVFAGASYGAQAQITHKTVINNNAKLIKSYIKILNKVGNNKQAVLEIEKKLQISPAGLKLYMKKGMGVGDAVFIKLIEDNTNAVNKADAKNFIKEYLTDNNTLSRLNGNEVNVKNVIKEMNGTVNLKVVNEVYKTETGVTVDHALSLAVNTPNTTHNLQLENYTANKNGSVYQTHTLQNQMNQVNNTQRQINQVNNTQRQINQVNNTQQQMQQMNNTQQQIQQTNNMQQQMMGR